MKNALSTSGRLRQRIASALLVLGVAVGALASTATPAHAASSIVACFSARRSIRPNTWCGWISDGGIPVPIAYQNYFTTVIVDYRYTQNGTTIAWYGWSNEYAAPGTAGYTQRTAITKFNVVSSADGVGVHSDYWH